MSNSPKIRLRDQRRPGWCWAENELLDVFLPLIGPNGVTLYMTMCRHARGSEVKDRGLRELGDLAGMSKDSVQRSLVKMCALGMVGERRDGKAKTRASYDLLDLKDLAALGVEELRRRMEKVVTVQAGLKAVSQGDSSGAEKPVGRTRKSTESVAVGDRYIDRAETKLSQPGPESATVLGSERDSPLNCIEKETTKTQNYTPLPPSRGGGERLSVEREGNLPPELSAHLEDVEFTAQPLSALDDQRRRWGSVKWELKQGLKLDGPPLALAEVRFGTLSADDLNDYDFAFHDVTLLEIEMDGEAMVWVLGALDPPAARRGLRKYHTRVQKLLRKMSPKVTVQLKVVVYEEHRRTA